MPPVFQWLKDNGGVASEEMYRTFNCGIGMIIAVPAERADEAIAQLQAAGEQALLVGHIADAAAGEEQVQLDGLH